MPLNGVAGTPHPYQVYMISYTWYMNSSYTVFGKEYGMFYCTKPVIARFSCMLPILGNILL